MSPLLLIPIALVVVLLSYAVVMQRRELQVLKRTVGDHLRAHVAPVALEQEDDEDAWPTGFLEVGAPFPQGDIASGGQWQIVVLVKAGCGACTRVLAELLSVREQVKPGYRVVIAATSFADVAPFEGVATVRFDDADVVPTPALVLVDPNGVVQGRGVASTAATIIAFAREGLDHGYGPPALVEERVHPSGHHSGTHVAGQHAPHMHHPTAPP